LLGILVGIAAASFIYIVRRSSEITANWNLFKRYSLAASITGFTAIFVPQVLGVGYDSLNQAILGQLSLATLIVILVMKLITSSISVGCGLPAGLIGPSFVIGAIGGSFMGLVLDQTLHLPVESSGLYAILGMAAMMGACLQAPLAALIAAFEITANPNIIWPSMLCIAVAQLVTRQVLKQGPVIDVILQSRGLNPVEDSLTQNLQRTGVSNIMNSDILTINAEQFASIRAGTLDISNEWLLLKSSTDNSISLFHQIDDLDKGTVVTRLSLIKSVAIDSRATLATARAYFRQYDVEVLHVINASNNAACLGVISRQQLSQYL
jgi:CIC family chloride channel protein